MPYDYLAPLIRSSHSKIVLLLLDGLGGLPQTAGGLTELETAHTPNMDHLAAEGTLGQTIPIKPGITPGSGPAHLALFGYDPLGHNIGRGALSAAGVGLDVKLGDVAARGNFCTLDADGKIVDRRAGRISSEASAPLVERLQSVQIPGVQVDVRQVKEYRFTVVMRGEGLSPELKDTDPQATGVPPLPVRAAHPAAGRTAELFNQWVAKAQKVLADQPKANGLTLRGFATDPGLQSYQDAYGLRAACVAVYPMYKGVSRLVGMDVIEFEGEKPEDEFAAVKRIWNDYDFFFIHIKKTDSMGEDGNFDGKVKIIEGVDKALPDLLALEPDVLIITGDHSTPAVMMSHSWHPVPFLLWAPATHISDSETQFGERACARGGLGTFPAVDAMSLALAHAGRLDKFGA
ncbi:MAG: 2,3-bisphosphoglycerate-independent phosphoglycerate mutase [Chloroflexi bacterium]|nr:2,3-bisphosphoglycerate-independent phosphoglycerate mutase [Chloroflexota bacterium]